MITMSAERRTWPRTPSRQGRPGVSSASGGSLQPRPGNVRRLVPDRGTSGGEASHLQVPVATCAAAWPTHGHPARPPRMSPPAFQRIAPPVRPLHIPHRVSRERLSETSQLPASYARTRSGAQRGLASRPGPVTPLTAASWPPIRASDTTPRSPVRRGRRAGVPEPHPYSRAVKLPVAMARRHLLLAASLPGVAGHPSRTPADVTSRRLG